MPLKSSISSHVRISYRFYEFVTTRYTTDFYIINGINVEGGFYSNWIFFLQKYFW